MGSRKRIDRQKSLSTLQNSNTQSFDYEKHVITLQNEKYIRIDREKTGIYNLVPLFPKVKNILAKYSNDMKNTVWR